MESRLTSITPIDGRYNQESNDIKNYHSEYSFIRYRIMVEIEYLISLGEFEIYDDISEEEKVFLRDIYKNFSLKNAKRVLEIEEKTKHDVKAIEYYIVDRIKNNDSLKRKNIDTYVHFCLTSQDVNSTANVMMLKSTIQKVILPKINEILKVCFSSHP